MPRRHSNFAYACQAAAVYMLYGMLRLLPARIASALGGALGQIIGKFHQGTARARKNLQLILPQHAAEHEKIIRAVWHNFGRVFAEYPHLQKLWCTGAVKVSGQELLAPYAGRPVVFVAPHLGNWEFNLFAAGALGYEVAAVYRPLNNPYLNGLLNKMRAANKANLFIKGAEGAMQLMRRVKAGGHAALLVDQRLSDGIVCDFMGQPALTTTMPAVLAVKYGAVIVPVETARLGGMRFSVQLHAPIVATPDADEKAEIMRLTQAINDLFGAWIMANPTQWLWTHDRWRGK